MPPMIQKTWSYLVTSVYFAEALAVMDLNLGYVNSSGTDAFVEVGFSGSKPVRTKTKTMKGDRDQINPAFNEELWNAVCLPSMTQVRSTLGTIYMLVRFVFYPLVVSMILVIKIL